MGAKNESIVDEWLEDDNLMLLESWARDGYTNKDICAKIGISGATLHGWRKRYPEIEKALKKGKEVIDYKVENALLKSALGYTVEEIKTIISGKPDKDGNRPVRIEKTIKEIAPNVTACVIWLNNRKPDQWKRNRDNVLELKENESNITVNIIRTGSKDSKSEITKEDEEEWSASVSKDTKQSEEAKRKENINALKQEDKAIEDSWDEVIAETEGWE